MNSTEEAQKQYTQLTVLTDRAVEHARAGNIKELEPILSSVEAAYKELKRIDPGLEAFHAASMKFGDGPNSVRILAYADDTDKLRSLGFLTAAEQALVRDDLHTAKKAYREIKPGTILRQHLDAQCLPDNNLKVRAKALEKILL